MLSKLPLEIFQAGKKTFFLPLALPAWYTGSNK